MTVWLLKLSVLSELIVLLLELTGRLVELIVLLLILNVKLLQSILLFPVVDLFEFPALLTPIDKIGNHKYSTKYHKNPNSKKN